LLFGVDGKGCGVIPLLWRKNYDFNVSLTVPPLLLHVVLKIVIAENQRFSNPGH
jgi:hypothetical protein